MNESVAGAEIDLGFDVPEGVTVRKWTDEEVRQLDGAPLTDSPEPEYHEVSDADYEFMVRKQNDLVMFGWAIQNVKKVYYQGTVPARVKRQRRATGKLARAARKLSRPAKRRTGTPRTKHAH